MGELPAEIITMILAYVAASARDALICSHVCWQWCGVVRAITRRWRKNLAHCAMRQIAIDGDRVSATWMRDRGYNMVRMGEIAAGYESARLIAWACSNNAYRAHRMFGRAASRGHVETLSLLARSLGGLQVEKCQQVAITVGAVRHGRVCTLEWLANHININGRVASETAAVRGQLAVLAWLDGQALLDPAYASEAAAVSDRTDTLEWLRVCGYRLSRSLTAIAVQRQSDRVLRWMLASGLLDGEYAYAVALANDGEPGMLTDLRWLHNTGVIERMQVILAVGCQPTKHNVVDAARTGCIQAMEWMVAHGAPLTPDACVAAVSGHIRTLIWLHEHGCPWDARTVDRAATLGNMCALEYAHAHGCPMRESALVAACRRGRTDAIRYILENGCPYDEDGPFRKTYDNSAAFRELVPKKHAWLRLAVGRLLPGLLAPGIRVRDPPTPDGG